MPVMHGIGVKRATLRYLNGRVTSGQCLTNPDDCCESVEGSLDPSTGRIMMDVVTRLCGSSTTPLSLEITRLRIPKSQVGSRWCVAVDPDEDCCVPSSVLPSVPSAVDPPPMYRCDTGEILQLPAVWKVEYSAIPPSPPVPSGSCLDHSTWLFYFDPGASTIGGPPDYYQTLQWTMILECPDRPADEPEFISAYVRYEYYSGLNCFWSVSGSARYPDGTIVPLFGSGGLAMTVNYDPFSIVLVYEPFPPFGPVFTWTFTEA